jgi:hypothetical protein
MILKGRLMERRPNAELAARREAKSQKNRKKSRRSEVSPDAHSFDGPCGIKIVRARCAFDMVNPI